MHHAYERSPSLSLPRILPVPSLCSPSRDSTHLWICMYVRMEAHRHAYAAGFTRTLKTRRGLADIAFSPNSLPFPDYRYDPRKGGEKNERGGLIRGETPSTPSGEWYGKKELAPERWTLARSLAPSTLPVTPGGARLLFTLIDALCLMPL